MNIYEYVRILGKIDDNVELRNEFIKIYDTKDKKDMVRWGIDYGKHTLELVGYDLTDEVVRGFEAMQEWLDDATWYQKARSVGGEFWDLARDEKDSVRKRFYQTMAQITCIPHCKYHALWASDYGVTLVNRMHPNNSEAVRNERKKQIELL